MRPGQWDGAGGGPGVVQGRDGAGVVSCFASALRATSPHHCLFLATRAMLTMHLDVALLKLHALS